MGALGIVRQSGGSVAADLLQMSGNYRYTDGNIFVTRGLILTGTLDMGGSGALLSEGNTVVDFSQGTVLNDGNARFVSGSRSLVIVPAGWSASRFGGGWAPGNLVHTAGTPLVVEANHGFEGWGSITDHVCCAGTIDAGGIAAVTESKGLNLANGVNLSAGASVNLRTGWYTFYDYGGAHVGGLLTVHDPNSGMSGGSLTAESEALPNPEENPLQTADFW